MSKPYLNFAECLVICSPVYSAPAIAAEAGALLRVSTDKPNFIFIKTDDQRFDSLSMTGHPVTKTRNIAPFATEGIFFKQAFSTSPICGPSLANFFTGQWGRKNRVGLSSVSQNFIPTAAFDNLWLMQIKRARYFAGYIGKHHTHVGELKQRNRYLLDALFNGEQSSYEELFNLKPTPKNRLTWQVIRNTKRFWTATVDAVKNSYTN